MNTETGEIKTLEFVYNLNGPERRKYVKMKLPLTPYQRATLKVGRNEPCPCGSGKKFKRCHLK